MLAELSRNDYYWIGIKKYLSFYIFTILILTIGRITFAFYFAPSGLISENILEVLYAFFLGFKYDTIVLSYIMTIPILLNILIALIGNRKVSNYFFGINGIYFFCMSVFVLVMVISDLGFYSFYQDHLNVLFFGLIEDDTQAVFLSIWKNYPVVWFSLGIFLVLYLLYRFIKFNFKFISRNERGIFTPGPMKFIVLVSITFLLLIGGLRGGYNWYVLAPQYSDFSKHQFINQIALNGFITFENAVRLRMSRNNNDFDMYKAQGFKTINKAFASYLSLPNEDVETSELIKQLERKTQINKKIENNKPHTIFLLAESFGGFWIDHNSQNFNFLGGLSKHFGEDYYFPNFLSVNNGTIGSLVHIQTSMINRPGQRYLNESKYMNTMLSSSVNIPYSENGYETTFIYGGKLSWRNIGHYFKSQGYDNLIGENALRDSLALEGDVGTEWGLYDEYIFEYIKKRLKNSTKPQFIFILSTSNHPPFQLPKSYKAKEISIPNSLSRKITREKELFKRRFQTFRYANDKVSEFIDWIKDDEALKNKTVFSFSGDHNFFSFLNYEHREKFLMYKVPLYIYLPQYLRAEGVDLNKLGSQEDIFATLIPLTLSNQKYVNFGENLIEELDTTAMNSNVIANSSGVIINDKPCLWQEIPYIATDCKGVKLKELSLKRRSYLSVIDYYLKYMYKEPYSLLDN